MLVMTKKAKTALFIFAAVVLICAGWAVERFEKDAYIIETSADEEDIPYSSDAEPVISDKININSAGKEELVRLKGIGEALAERIIKYREENGVFGSPEDIMKVSGISAGKFEEFRDDICAE